jgi:hypothetical protein
MKLNKYNTSRTIPKSNRYILETVNSPIIYIQDWLVIGTAKKNDRIKLFVWAQPSSYSLNTNISKATKEFGTFKKIVNILGGIKKVRERPFNLKGWGGGGGGYGFFF